MFDASPHLAPSVPSRGGLEFSHFLFFSTSYRVVMRGVRNRTDKCVSVSSFPPSLRMAVVIFRARYRRNAPWGWNDGPPSFRVWEGAAVPPGTAPSLSLVRRCEHC